MRDITEGFIPSRRILRPDESLRFRKSFLQVPPGDARKEDGGFGEP